MQNLLLIWAWLAENGPVILGGLMGLVAFAEVIVTFTPTKTDDLFVERIGAGIRRIMEFFKVPNRAAGGGVHPTLKEKAAVKNEEPPADAA